MPRYACNRADCANSYHMKADFHRAGGKSSEDDVVFVRCEQRVGRGRCTKEAVDGSALCLKHQPPSPPPSPSPRPLSPSPPPRCEKRIGRGVCAEGASPGSPYCEDHTDEDAAKTISRKGLPSEVDIFDYRDGVDKYTNRSRRSLAVETTHRDHVLEVQLCDLVWQNVLADDAYKSLPVAHRLRGHSSIEREMVNALGNLNVTTEYINLRKGPVFKKIVATYRAGSTCELEEHISGHELDDGVWARIQSLMTAVTTDEMVGSADRNDSKEGAIAKLFAYQMSATMDTLGVEG